MKALDGKGTYKIGKLTYPICKNLQLVQQQMFSVQLKGNWSTKEIILSNNHNI